MIQYLKNYKETKILEKSRFWKTNFRFVIYKNVDKNINMSLTYKKNYKYTEI